jgi:hypothetical protein
MAASPLLLIILAAVVLGVFVTALVYLILWLVGTLRGSTGGWTKLAQTYATDRPPEGESVSRATMVIGAVTYKRCVSAWASADGLFLRVWRKTALIPWAEFQGIGRTTLYWESVPVLTVGEPPVASVAVQPAVFDMIRKYLPARLTVPG